MFPIDQHLLWACGHAAMLFSAAIILIQTCLFRTVPLALYKFGYLGALLSYCIVILKSLGKPQANIQWIQRAFVDENVQYAVLALYWFVSKPVNLSVLPFATFSLFHCLTFLRQNVLPRFAPKPVAGAAAGAPSPQNWASNYMRTIQVWVKSHYDTAMRFVAFAELAILARVTVGALTSFLAPLFLAHFIRLRFHASPFSRSAVSAVVHRIDGLAAGQGGGIQNGWLRVKGAIASWGGGNLVPAQGGQAGPAQGNAQARR